MRTLGAGAVMVLLALAGPAVRGAEPATPAVGRFEVTPFVGYRFGGRFDVQGSNDNAQIDDHPAYGFALGLRPDRSMQYEVLFTRQSTAIGESPELSNADLDVEQLHFQVTASSERAVWLNPYALGSLGVTKFSLDVPGAEDETRFSLSAGGGLRIPVQPRFDVRLEARVYLTFMNSSSSIFCNTSTPAGTCVLTGSASVLVQYELLAGAAFTF
jgi:opacity protein-like surface antigen